MSPPRLRSMASCLHEEFGHFNLAPSHILSSVPRRGKGQRASRALFLCHPAPAGSARVSRHLYPKSRPCFSVASCQWWQTVRKQAGVPSLNRLGTKSRLCRDSAITVDDPRNPATICDIRNMVFCVGQLGSLVLLPWSSYYQTLLRLSDCICKMGVASKLNRCQQ